MAKTLIGPFGETPFPMELPKAVKDVNGRFHLEMVDNKPTISINKTIHDAIIAQPDLLKDCIDNLLRQAARGEEWATKLLFERLSDAPPKK